MGAESRGTRRRSLLAKLRFDALAQVLAQQLGQQLGRFYYLLAESHRYFGNTYGLKSEQQKAIRALDRAISHNPRFGRAYLERGILYWREMDQPERAIYDLTIAYELNPRLIEARFNRGIAHQQLGDYAEATADFGAYLAQGRHPHWRAYAETMIRELKEWVPEAHNGLPT
jgi:tetratricopeptide (TPR) repeat protein